MGIGKKSKDIFTPADQDEQRGPGRPTVHEESWTKASVVMMDRQIVFLDELAVDIRKQSGAVIRRAEIIRALVDALAESGVDVAGVTSEEDLRNLLTAKLKKTIVLPA